MRFHATLMIFAAALAALIAHVAIDVLGDFLVAHDTYDGVAHGSRGMVTAIVVLALVGLPLIVAFKTLRDRRRAPELRRRIAASMPPLLWFVVTVVVVCGAFVIGMEMADAWGASEAIIDLDGALGGSPALGLGVVALTGILSALVARSIARWMVFVGETLVALGVWFQRRANIDRTSHSRAQARRRFARIPRVLSPLALCAAKRGPPHELRLTGPFAVRCS